MDRELIHVHVGQAGVQMGELLWEQYSSEHEIDSQGQAGTATRTDSHVLTIFAENFGRYFPRAICVDTDPMCIEQVGYGRFKNFFHTDMLIKGKEDGGSCYARTSKVKDSIDGILSRTMDKLRQVAEHCSALEGFILMRSISGGTGSGLGDAILDQICNDFGKKTKVETTLFPSPNLSSVVTEPYNALLSASHSMEKTDCSIIFDNQSAFEITTSKIDKAEPHFEVLNRTIALYLAGATSSARFTGSMNLTLSDLQTNLVPFKRIHFPLLSYSPVASVHWPSKGNLVDFTVNCFEPDYHLIKCDPKSGKYMSCVFLYRGEFSMATFNQAMERVEEKKLMNLVPWAKSNYKIGASSRCPGIAKHDYIAHSPQSVCLISNNTVISKSWNLLVDQFADLYESKAFVHHYLREGFDEAIFQTAIEEITSLVNEYKNIESAETPGV